MAPHERTPEQVAPLTSCREIRDQLVAGAAELDPAQTDHLAHCTACELLAAERGELAHALQAFAEGPMAEIDALADATLSAVRAKPSLRERVRQLSTRRRAALLSAGVLFATVLVAALMRRIDMPMYPFARLSLSLAALTGLVAWCAALLLRPLHRPPIPAWARAPAPWLALLVPVVVAALPAAHTAHTASVAGVGDDLFTRASACFVFGSVWCVFLGALAWLIDRRGLRDAWRRVSVLVAAAAFGNVLLVLHCPLTAPVHKLAGHATVSLAVVLVAVLLRFGRQR